MILGERGSTRGAEQWSAISYPLKHVTIPAVVRWIAVDGAAWRMLSP